MLDRVFKRKKKQRKRNEKDREMKERMQKEMRADVDEGEEGENVERDKGR